jgi:hypothetical protein
VFEIPASSNHRRIARLDAPTRLSQAVSIRRHDCRPSRTPTCYSDAVWSYLRPAVASAIRETPGDCNLGNQKSGTIFHLAGNPRKLTIFETTLPTFRSEPPGVVQAHDPRSQPHIWCGRTSRISSRSHVRVSCMMSKFELTTETVSMQVCALSISACSPT